MTRRRSQARHVGALLVAALLVAALLGDKR